MKQISQLMALYLFNGNNEVFLLYPDGTESVVTSEQDIYKHSHQLEFYGVED